MSDQKQKPDPGADKAKEQPKKQGDFKIEEVEGQAGNVSGGNCIGCNSCSSCSNPGCNACG